MKTAPRAGNTLGVPVANFGVLADAADEVESSVEFEDTGHLDVVVETGMMQGGVGLELIWSDLFHQSHAAASYNGAVFDSCGHEEPALAIERAEVRIAKADPLAAFGKVGLVVVGPGFEGEAAFGIDQGTDGICLLWKAGFAGLAD